MDQYNEKHKPNVHDVGTAIDVTESCYSTAGDSVVSSTVNKPNGLRRGLKARHIQMIALGGTIGKAYNLYTKVTKNILTTSY
jgi:amino acid permease